MTNYVAFDFEAANLTAAIDPNTDVWCCGFASKDGSSVHSSWDSPDWKEVLRYHAENPETIFVVHNAAFDVAVARTNGLNITPGRYHDTMLMSYLLNPGGDHSLESWGKRLGFEKLDLRKALIEAGCLDRRSKQGAEFDIDYKNNERARKILEEYCERDCVLTLKLFHYLMKQLKKDKRLLDCYLSIELPYVETIMEMNSTGMYVLRDTLLPLKNHINEKITTTLDNIRVLAGGLVPGKEKIFKKGKYHGKTVPVTYYGGAKEDGTFHASDPFTVYDHCLLEDFNPNSDDHIAKALIRRGVNLTEKTKTGKFSVSSKVLKNLDDDLARALIDYSLLEKLKTSFVEPLSDLSEKDGFVRSTYNQCVTLTSRLSSSNPNLQNIPARSELGSKMRESIGAPPGYTLCVADLDSIELKVLAYYLKHVCGESRMYDAIMRGEDLHQKNAEAWGLEKRSDAKKIFAVIYGGGAAAVGAYGNGGTPQEGQKILDSMRSGMPAIWDLMEIVYVQCKKMDGVLYTLLGNRLYYPDIKSENDSDRARAQRQCFNAIIQGTAAGINKELMLQVSDVVHKYKGRISFAVHDEAGVYIPNCFVEEFLKEANKVYNNSVLLKYEDWYIPVTGTWNSGTNWKIAKG